MSESEKKPGQVKKTPKECREAFEIFTATLALSSLRMSVDSKGRYNIHKDIDGIQSEHVVGPLASNSFVKLLQGSQKLVAACQST